MAWLVNKCVCVGGGAVPDGHFPVPRLFLACHFCFQSIGERCLASSKVSGDLTGVVEVRTVFILSIWEQFGIVPLGSVTPVLLFSYHYFSFTKRHLSSFDFLLYGVFSINTFKLTSAATFSSHFRNISLLNARVEQATIQNNPRTNLHAFVHIPKYLRWQNRTVNQNNNIKFIRQNSMF